MNRLSLYFSVLLLSTIIFLGCHKIDKDSLNMQTFTFEKEYPLFDTLDVGSLDYVAEVELPVGYKNAEVLRNVQKQIIAKIFGELFNSVSLDSLLPMYGKMLLNESQRITNLYMLDSVDIANHAVNKDVSIQGVAMYVDDKILSYSYERYAYLGGDQGTSIRFLYNFDLTNSKPIKESDIFKYGYEESLTQLIKEQIVEDNASLESVGDLSELNYFDKEIKPNNNFYITPEGLAYVYNPYDIATYSIGQIQVLLTFDKLRPIMKPNNLLEFLYKQNNDNEQRK